jgi:hypothetical protein
MADEQTPLSTRNQVVNIAVSPRTITVTGVSTKPRPVAVVKVRSPGSTPAPPRARYFVSGYFG